MKELISIHCGQAGIQLGNACWELFSAESNINPNGELSKQKENSLDNLYFNPFFSENSSGAYKARAAFIDLDPYPINDIKKSSYKDLFSKNNLISLNQDSACTFCSAYCTLGQELTGVCFDSIRKLVEECDNLQGFIFTHSIGGGTGSGLGSLLLQHLSQEYGKKLKFSYSIFPSPRFSDLIIEPYNATLAIERLIDHTDLCNVFDNEALYEICHRYLEIENPSFVNINRLIAQQISSVFQGLQYNSMMDCSLEQFVTNIVPYKSLHFLLNSYSPICTPENIYNKINTVANITDSAFEPCSTMAKCNPKLGKYFACSLFYRGDVTVKEVYTSISDLKTTKQLKFTNQGLYRFKVGVCNQPPFHISNGDMANVRKAVSLAFNSTICSSIFDTLSFKFDLLYSKRAFAHWFVGNVMEAANLSEARNEMDKLLTDYMETAVY